MKIYLLKKFISTNKTQVINSDLFGPSYSLMRSNHLLHSHWLIVLLTFQVATADAQLSNSSITDDLQADGTFRVAALGVGAISIFSIFGFFGLSIFCYSRLFRNSQIYQLSDSEESKEEPQL